MIRLGVHEDIPAIIKIGQEIIDKSETYDGEIDVQKGSYMLRRAINDRKMDLFIATKADQVVGFFVCSAKLANPSGCKKPESPRLRGR